MVEMMVDSMVEMKVLRMVVSSAEMLEDYWVEKTVE